MKGELLSVELGRKKFSLWSERGDVSIGPLTQGTALGKSPMEHPEDNKVAVGENQYLAASCKATVG